MTALSARFKLAVQATTRRMGVEVRRCEAVAPGYPVKAFRPRARLFASLGVTTVLDVGANRGQYARALRAAGYEGRIVSFEPVAEPLRELRAHAAGDPLWEVYPFALADTDDDAVIHVAGNTAGSSFLLVGSRLTANFPEMAVVGAEPVARRRLDGLVDELSIEDAFMKLDVQGFERWALEGARNALARIRGVELELSFAPLYEGESVFLEMARLLEELGFRLVGVLPGAQDLSTGLPLQVDALFEKVRTLSQTSRRFTTAARVSA
jgi:FkbM family methyltransferase